MTLITDYSKFINNRPVKKKKKKQKTNKQPVLQKGYTKQQLAQIEQNKQREASPMEIKIAAHLKALNLLYKKEYSNATLFNPKTKYLLFIDFYLPKLNIAIEYDGKQHFVNEDITKLKSQMYRDNVKTKWCKEHGVKLLRINFINQNKYEEIINSFISKNI